MSQNENASNRLGRAPPAALNPDAPGLTQPFKDFVSRGLVSIKVEFGPMGTKIGGTPYGLIRKEGESDSTLLPLGEIKSRIEEAGVSNQRPRANGKKTTAKQPLPTRSLCKQDFESGEANLLHRIRAVGNSIGSDVARARILTAKANASGYESFDEWWIHANHDQRSLVLVDRKHAEEIGQSMSMLTELDIQCPFRGSLGQEKNEKAAQKVVQIPTQQSAKGNGATINGVDKGTKPKSSPKK